MLGDTIPQGCCLFPPLALVWVVFGVFIMRPVVRGSVNKSRSVRQFRKNSGRTKRANVSTAPSHDILVSSVAVKAKVRW